MNQYSLQLYEEQGASWMRSEQCLAKDAESKIDPSLKRRSDREWNLGIEQSSSTGYEQTPVSGQLDRSSLYTPPLEGNIMQNQ